MHERQRLLRYDPKLADAPPVPLRAVLSHVQRMATDRHVVFPAGELPPLAADDNSLAFHFLAPGSAFARTVTFETKLEGGGGDWVAVGAVGAAYFNQLKEGRYTLRVRPRSSDAIGEETRFVFSIRPPWYRTSAAYLIYAACTLFLVGMVTGGWVLLNRR